MITKWNFDDGCLKRAIDGVNTNKGCLFIGQVQIGNLMVDFNLTSYDEATALDFDVFVGGVDSGYGYTEKNKIPYDYVSGGSIINKKNIYEFTSLDKFKEIALSEIKEFIDNHSKSDLLKEKANTKDPLNWE